MAGDWIGETLNGRYEILELLGTGGMSSVYKANDSNLGRVVAVKIIHQHLSSNPDFLRRFEDEATAVAQLRHPNIVQVYDFDTLDGTAFIVFEFVAGENLQEMLARLAAAGRRMPVDDCVRIAGKVANALDYAHNRGLIHRDVKPANIIVDVHGEVFLTDFGIVKIIGGIEHTVTGAVVGTARYMSPEQIRGGTLDSRTDLYSLGVTMFEMTSGRPPYEADSAMTLMMMHVNDPVPNLAEAGVPSPLDAVIRRSLAKDPEDRYSTAGDLAADLLAVDTTAAPATQMPVEATPDPDPAPDPAQPESAAPATEKSGGSRRLIAMIVGGLAAVALIAGVVFALAGGGSDEPESETIATTAVVESTVQDEPAVVPNAAASNPETVAITGITEEGGRYLVDYETTGYTEALPGEHVHFYWNSIYESEAGVGPNGAEWFVWGGPRPFNGYGVSDVPPGASAICSVVANPDHTIKPGTGNCWDLP